MSCPKSQNASMVEASTQLDEAVAYGAEEGFFASVEPIGQVEWDALCTDHDTWLESSVRFHGPLGGALRCRLPLALARALGSGFLGLENGELPPARPAGRRPPRPPAAGARPRAGVGLPRHGDRRAAADRSAGAGPDRRARQ